MHKYQLFRYLVLKSMCSIYVSVFTHDHWAKIVLFFYTVCARACLCDREISNLFLEPDRLRTGNSQWMCNIRLIRHASEGRQMSPNTAFYIAAHQITK